MASLWLDRGRRVADDTPISDAFRRDLLALRTTLARELETINEYERLIDDAATPEVKSLLAHLRDEEKEHVAECMMYIRRLDPAQEAYFGYSMEDLLGGAPRHGKTAPAPKAAPRTPGFTVGSLKGPKGSG